MKQFDLAQIQSPVLLRGDSLGAAPAAAMVFVLLPKTANLKALKFDGISGWLEFEENKGGINGTGANGTEITLNGTAYLVYGEIRIVAGETFIKVEDIWNGGLY